MNKTAFDLVIFDMDGTLVDSMDCLADWIHRAIKDHCPDTVTPATVTAAFGPTEEQIIERFVGPELLKSCLERYYNLYESEHERVYVYPGINELLRELKRKGTPMALCTGKSRRAVEISLKRLEWDSLFQTIITGDDTSRFKPDPEGINKILSQVKAEKSRTLFIGDSPADTAAAKNAGIFSGRALWGIATSALDTTSVPTYIFTEPRSAIAILSPNQ